MEKRGPTDRWMADMPSREGRARERWTRDAAILLRSSIIAFLWAPQATHSSPLSEGESVPLCRPQDSAIRPGNKQRTNI